MISRRERCSAASVCIGTRFFFGIVQRGQLYFKTDDATVGAYRKRRMKPFRPNAKQTLKSYYQVPVDIIEDADELTRWARDAVACQHRRSAGR